MPTPLQSVIEAQRSHALRGDEKSKPLEFLRTLAASKLQNPNSVSADVFRSALGNAITSSDDSDLQNSLLDYYGLTTKMEQPTAQTRVVGSGKNKRMMQFQPELSASQFNEQQSQHALEYNKTAALHNQLLNYQNQQEAQGASEANQNQDYFNKSRIALGNALGFPMQTQGNMTIDGQQFPSTRINPNAPTLEQLQTHVRQLSPTQQAQLYAKGLTSSFVGSVEGSKMLENLAKQPEDMMLSRIKVLGDEMARGNISVSRDEKGNRVYTQWLTDPNASPADIAMGKGRKQLPISPLQTRDLMEAMKRGLLPDIDDIMPATGQNLAGANSTLIKATVGTPGMSTPLGQSMLAARSATTSAPQLNDPLARSISNVFRSPQGDFVEKVAGPWEDVKYSAQNAVNTLGTGIANLGSSVWGGLTGQEPNRYAAPSASLAMNQPESEAMWQQRAAQYQQNFNPAAKEWRRNSLLNQAPVTPDILSGVGKLASQAVINASYAQRQNNDNPQIARSAPMWTNEDYQNWLKSQAQESE